MKTVDIVERIEGEAKLNCTWEDGKVSDARIDFLNFRGFEYILEGKSPLDALIYTPRICGICGQAHLKATVEALENIYENAGAKLTITPKAKLLREIGLNIEIIDSHIKWFYMFIMPDIIKLDTNDLNIYEPIKGSRWLEASKVASETIKALAIIGGQWPHTSYMLPGGVMSDPTLLDLSTMKNYLKTAVNFFEKTLSGVSFDEYLSFNSINDFDKLNGDLKYFIDLSLKYDLQNYGKSHNRFISLSQSNLFSKGIKDSNIKKDIDYTKIFESEKYTYTLEDTTSPMKHTWSKSVTYDSKFFETGPLARAIISKREFISNIHKEYDDSILTRVMSRMDEFAHLLNDTLELISKVDISQESHIKPNINLKNFNDIYGESSVEACRGSLYHKITLHEGKIFTYNVITPTVWNLGPKNSKEEGIAINAILGTPSIELAKIVLRSFDVCSVCTTH